MAKPDTVSGEPTKKRFGPWGFVIQGAARPEGPARHPVRHLRLFRGAQAGAPLIVEYADRMRGFAGQAVGSELRRGGRNRLDPRTYSRLWPHQAPALAEVKPKEAELLAAFDYVSPEVVAAE